MSVLRSHCAYCGTQVASRSARREGRLWFCSQSCFLQAESSWAKVSSPLGGTWMRQPSRPRRPVRSAGRVLWKTTKTVVTVVVLIVVAVVIAAIVALAHGGKKLDADTSKSEQTAHRAAVMYRHIRVGMTGAQVQRLLGKPYDVQRYSGPPETCWYYGSLLTNTHTYEFCLRHNGLVSKSRMT